MGEIVTIQLGNYANYVGAHFWNFQDEAEGRTAWGDDEASLLQEICSEKLYRVGEDRRGAATYSPRLVAVDLKGSLGSVAASEDRVAGEPPAVLTWTGQAATFTSDPVERNAFLQALDQEHEAYETAMLGAEEEEGGEEEYDEAADPMVQAASSLDHSVNYWTDFLKAQLLPRSLYLLPGLWQGVALFEGFGDGVAAMQSSATRDDLGDRVRQYLEECDRLQGFHLLAEDLSGFGGVASWLATELRDEYPGTPMLLFSVNAPLVHPHYYGAPPPDPDAGAEQPPEIVAYNKQVQSRTLSRTLATALLTEHADVYCPMGCFLPKRRYLDLDPVKPFHSSSLLGAAIDTATSSYRLRNESGSTTGQQDMRSMMQLLRWQGGAPLASMSMAFPAPNVPSRGEADASGVTAGTDERMQAADGSAPEASTSAPGGFASSPLDSLESLTDGMAAHTREARARMLTLRGGRCGGKLAPLAERAAWLEHGLVQSGAPLLCRQQRACIGASVPVPVCFPRVFGPSVLPAGDLQEPPAAPRPADQLVSSVGVLTMMEASSAFTPTLNKLQRLFQSSTRSLAGRMLMQTWGYSNDEMTETSDRILTLARSYKDDDDLSTDDDDDDSD